MAEVEGWETGWEAAEAEVAEVAAAGGGEEN